MNIMATSIKSIERIPTSNDEAVIIFANGAQQLVRVLFEEDGMWIILSASSKLVAINPDMDCKVLAEGVSIR
jgi:hypothetical protein